MSEDNTIKNQKNIAKAYMAYHLDIPEESITDVLLVDKSGEGMKPDSYVILKTSVSPQANKIANVSKDLYKSLGLTARQETDGVYISGLGKTSKEILSLLGETKDIFEVLDETERKQGRSR